MISNLRYFLSFLFILVYAGCGAAEGSPCKEKNDCSSGLLCCPTNRLSATVRGTCQEVCGTTSDMDAGTEDASLEDAGGDGDVLDAQSDSDSSDAGNDANSVINDAMIEGG